MIKRVRGIAGVTLVVGILIALSLVPVAAFGDHSSDSSTPSSSLSPYWDFRVSRWESLIVQEAQRRKLDPDLVASLMWRESRGDPNAIGPSGSVGLLQIMPKEAGFTWRPSRDELLVPSINVSWGSRLLSTIISQARGDISGALAAYNGGWDRANNRGPRAFAATILRDYARAVADRHGLQGHWVAFFAILDGGIQGPIWVADSARDDLYFFGDANVTPEGTPMIPLMSPAVVVAECEAKPGEHSLIVGLWVYHVDEGRWLSGQNVLAPPPVAPVMDRTTGPARAGAVSPAVMAGSVRPATAAPVAPQGQTVVKPDPAGVPVAGPVPESATEPVVECDLAASATDLVSDTLETQPPNCEGGPLWLDSYPLQATNTPEGWTAQIFAWGRGGTCSYTYAWDDESGIQARNVQGPIVFEIPSTRRDSPLLGTVVVTSGEEIARVRLYIPPPD